MGEGNNTKVLHDTVVCIPSLAYSCVYSFTGISKMPHFGGSNNFRSHLITSVKKRKVIALFKAVNFGAVWEIVTCYGSLTRKLFSYVTWEHSNKSLKKWTLRETKLAQFWFSLPPHEKPDTAINLVFNWYLNLECMHMLWSLVRFLIPIRETVSNIPELQVSQSVLLLTFSQ